MDNYLMHHGVKGQRKGIRRYQNNDATRTLTPEGRIHYGVGPPREAKSGSSINKDDRWAKKNQKSITKKVERMSAKEIAKFDKSKEIRVLKGKTFINAHNKKLAELMNRDAAAMRLQTPNGRAIRFVANRGDLGVSMFLGDENALKNYSSGVWANGRSAYSSKYTKVV